MMLQGFSDELLKIAGLVPPGAIAKTLGQPARILAGAPTHVAAHGAAVVPRRIMSVGGSAGSVVNTPGSVARNPSRRLASLTLPG